MKSILLPIFLSTITLFGFQQPLSAQDSGSLNLIKQYNFRSGVNPISFQLLTPTGNPFQVVLFSNESSTPSSVSTTYSSYQYKSNFSFNETPDYSGAARLLIETLSRTIK